MLNKVIEIAKEAGAILLEKKKKLKSLSIQSKETQGLVTEADQSSEDLILKKIKTLTPDYHICSEENFFNKKEIFSKKLLEDFCWYVDPLDGTNNFIAGLDYYAVSIALADKGKLILGVVYAPERDELFYADQGGAFFEKAEQKIKLQIDQNKTLDQSLLLTCLSTLSCNKHKLEHLFELNKKAMSIRRFGAAALDLCHVAKGTVGGFWDQGLKPWDLNAGAFICKQAGAKVSDYNNLDFNPLSSSIIVGNELINSAISNTLGSSGHISK